MALAAGVFKGMLTNETARRVSEAFEGPPARAHEFFQLTYLFQ